MSSADRWPISVRRRRGPAAMGAHAEAGPSPQPCPPYFAFGGASLLVVDAWAAGGAWVMGLLAAGGIAYVIGGLTVQHQSAE